MCVSKVRPFLEEDELSCNRIKFVSVDSSDTRDEETLDKATQLSTTENVIDVSDSSVGSWTEAKLRECEESYLGQANDPTLKSCSSSSPASSGGGPCSCSPSTPHALVATSPRTSFIKEKIGSAKLRVADPCEDEHVWAV